VEEERKSDAATGGVGVGTSLLALENWMPFFYFYLFCYVAVVVPEQCGLGESTYWANISFVDPSFVFLLFLHCGEREKGEQLICFWYIEAVYAEFLLCGVMACSHLI